MGSSLIILQQGTPAEAEDTVTLLGIGSAGDPSALRRLVYPSSVSMDLPPVVYSVAGLACTPTRTLNLDNAVLTTARAEAVKTLGSTRVVRFDEGLEDTIVTEVWEGSANRAAMPTSLFRQLYEYWINPPPFSLSGQAYIRWEPRDRSTKVYEVELLDLSVGGEGGFDVADLRELGGRWGGGSIDNALDSVNATPTGWIDKEVRLRMRIVAEA